MINNGIGNDWNLPVIAQPKEHALLKRLNPHPPSQDIRGSILKGEKMELESDIRWEKGIFIDIYA